MVNLEIKMGRHEMATELLGGMGLLVAKYLKGFIPSGEYVAYLGKKVNTNGFKKEMVKPVKLKGNTITLVAQPDGNGVCLEVHVNLKGQNVADIFKRMNGTKKRKGAREKFTIDQQPDDSAGTQTVSSAEKLKDEKGVNEMENQESEQSGSLQVKKIISDSETVDIILLSLMGLQEKNGYFNAAYLNEVLIDNQLTKVKYSAQAMGRLFAALSRLGHVQIDKETRNHKLSEVARLRLTANKPPADFQQEDMVQQAEDKNSENDEAGKKRKFRMGLIDDLTQAERELEKTLVAVEKAQAELAILKEEEEKAHGKIKEIKDKLLAELK